jgi:hypothetical protein
VTSVNSNNRCWGGGGRDCHRIIEANGGVSGGVRLVLTLRKKLSRGRYGTIIPFRIREEIEKCIALFSLEYLWSQRTFRMSDSVLLEV